MKFPEKANHSNPTRAAAIAIAMALASASAQATIFTSEAAFIAANGAGTVINFDSSPGGSIAGGTAIDLQYLSLGVDFNSYAGGSLIAASFIPASSPNVLLVGGAVGAAGGFEAEFTTLRSSVGLLVGGLQGGIFGSTTFEALGAGGVSLGIIDLNTTLGSSEFGYLFFGFSSASGIESFRIDGGDLDFVWFDDVRFGPAAAVPDVGSTMPLLGIGLGLLSFFRFRKASARSRGRFLVL